MSNRKNKVKRSQSNKQKRALKRKRAQKIAKRVMAQSDVCNGCIDLEANMEALWSDTLGAHWLSFKIVEGDHVGTYEMGLHWVCGGGLVILDIPPHVNELDCFWANIWRITAETDGAFMPDWIELYYDGTCYSRGTSVPESVPDSVVNWLNGRLSA